VNARCFLAVLIPAPFLAGCGGAEHPPGPGDCEEGPRGIDVSAFNGAIDWGAVADSGIDFAFAKASEGLTICDDRFQANWLGMRANGLTRGAYHFFHPGDDGSVQADAFLGCAGIFGPDDLPPVLDWETSDASDVSEAIASAQAFVAEIRARTGLSTVIYTYRDYWDTLGDPAQFGSQPLWLASYSASCPTVPPPWSNWLFWQYADDGNVPGVAGAVDVDRFAGTLAELHAWAGSEASDAGAIDAGRSEVGEPATEARTGCGLGGGPGCAALWCWLLVGLPRRQCAR